MMERLERRASAYGLLAVLALAAEFFVSHIGSDGGDLLTPTVEQIRYIVSFGLLGGCGLSCALSSWYIGRYVYFAEWPERFHEGDDL